MAQLVTTRYLRAGVYRTTGGVNRNILPQVYCDFSGNKAIPLTRVFLTPVITNVATSSNQLRKTMGMLNIPLRFASRRGHA